MINELLDDIVEDGRTVLFLGEAGIGKSALLDHAGLEARARGYTVVRSDGVEFESEISYSSLNQALLPLRQYIDALDPAHVHALAVVLGTRSGDQPDRLVISTAALHLLAAAGTGAPVLFLGDDLQWTDQRSREVFFFLTRRLAGTRVGMLGAARPGYGGVSTTGRLEHHLAPLEPADADHLLRQRFPALAPRIRARLLDEARGNPLALLELPPALSPPVRADRQSAPATLPLSSRLESVFAARISSLPVGAQELLLLAALDGTGDLGILQAAGGEELAGLDDAERSGLVRVNLDDRRLVFRHPLTRAAVVEGATESQRRQAHRKLAAAREHDLDKQAWHLGEAALGPDEELAALLEARGRRALARGDFGGLPSLIRSAELSPDPGQRGRRIAEATFVAAHKSGAPAHLARTIADLRETEAGTETALFLAATTAWLIVDSGEDIESGLRILTAAVEAIRPEVDRSGPAMSTSLRVLGLVCLYVARPELARPALDLIRRVEGLPAAVSDRLAAVLDPAGTDPEVLAAIDRDLADVRTTEDPVEVVRLGSQVTFLDRQAALRPTLERLLVVESGGVHLTEEIDVRRLLFEEAWLSGRWERARALGEEIEVMADAFHLGRPKVGVYVIRGFIAAATGDEDALRQCTDALLRWTLSSGGRLTQLAGHLILAQHAAATGDFEECFARASTLVGDADGPPPFLPVALWGLLDYTEAAVSTGRVAVAGRFAATLRRRGVDRLSSRYALVVGAAEALVTADGAEAAGRFARALDGPGADACAFDHARVALLAAERLAADGASAPAAAWLDVAAGRFTALGARPWLDRVARARDAIERDPGQPHVPAGLTPTEYKIVSLAAAGLTNKEIGKELYLSPRTVSTYLYTAFPKLNVTTRAGLRDALGRAESPR